MSEQNKPFVITDRRKFTSEGELRPDAAPSPEKERDTPTAAAPEPKESEPKETEPKEPTEPKEELPPLTAEQTDQARAAYEQTADRLDTAIRATNPGMEHPPAMNFEQIVHSVYMTALLQLGGATPEGEQPRIDLMGARQSVDMLAVLGEKTKGNLTPEETRLLDTALFELRMGFLEITQALARSAATKAPGSTPGSAPGSNPGPSIVR
jgi:hypothetical protein